MVEGRRLTAGLSAAPAAGHVCGLAEWSVAVELRGRRCGNGLAGAARQGGCAGVGGSAGLSKHIQGNVLLHGGALGDAELFHGHGRSVRVVLGQDGAALLAHKSAGRL